MFRFMLISGVTVSAIVYLMMPKFPPTASNRGLKTFVWAFLKITDAACAVGSLFGVSPVNTTRAIGNLAISDKRVDTVEEFTTQMDGVEVVVFKPAGSVDRLRPGIIHYHGGGWVLMNVALYAPVIRALVEETQSTVVSVNYRLAPEYPFPIPIEDCLKATKYFLKNAEKYGVDPNNVGIKGDSAGGNLAMATILSLNKEDNPDLPKFTFMSLDYPALQALDFDLPSWRTHEFGPGFMNKRMMLQYWLLYGFGHTDYYDAFYTNTHLTEDIRNEYEKQMSLEYLSTQFTDGHVKNIKKGNATLTKIVKDVVLNPLFSPLVATEEDLRKFPRTYIMNAEFDVLRDDGFILAERLRQAGVEVEHSYLPSEQHGIFNLIEIDDTARMEIKKMAKFVERV